MAKADHGPTDSALAHLIAATKASAMSFKGESKKAEDAIRTVKDARHKKELTALWHLIEAGEGDPTVLGRARAQVEAWNKRNFPTGK